MTETIQVTLDSSLLSSLKQMTEQQGVSLERIFADLAQQYVQEQRSQKIRAETKHYTAMHAELKKKYLGQHVAIHEGRLIDHDADASRLVRRVRQYYGLIPIMFTQVEEAPEPELVIRSPQSTR